MSDLLGGIHAVTLGDVEARRRRTQKTVLERKAPPTFDTLVEIRSRDRLSVYHDTAGVVDAFLRGKKVRAQVRLRSEDGFEVVEEAETPPLEEAIPVRESRARRIRKRNSDGRTTLRIFPYGVSKDRLSLAIRDLQVPATIARNPADANQVLTLKSHEKRQPKTLQELEERGLEIAVIRSNTLSQMKGYLEDAFGLEQQINVEDEALREARAGVDRVLSHGDPVELSPQASQIRRLQHMLIEEMGLGSHSTGEMPWRRVVILPTRG